MPRMKESKGGSIYHVEILSRDRRRWGRATTHGLTVRAAHKLKNYLEKRGVPRDRLRITGGHYGKPTRVLGHHHPIGSRERPR